MNVQVNRMELGKFNRQAPEKDNYVSIKTAINSLPMVLKQSLR